MTFSRYVPAVPNDNEASLVAKLLELRWRRRWFGMLRFVSHFAHLDEGEVMRKGWGVAWVSYTRAGAWTCPIPFNWVIYWGLRFYWSLMNPTRFDRRRNRR